MKLNKQYLNLCLFSFLFLHMYKCNNNKNLLICLKTSFLPLPVYAGVKSSSKRYVKEKNNNRDCDTWVILTVSV
jgi:hypothetical protein